MKYKLVVVESNLELFSIIFLYENFFFVVLNRLYLL